MLNLIKPERLRPGDKIAAVSLSWGGAGDPDLIWRYQLGKERLKTEFGLEVVEMENTLKGSGFLYEHPEKRAADLMEAFRDPSIKGIFSCIGGEDSIRMLPYIDFETIRGNPKIFLGYSDSTVTHFMCMKGRLSSFYGPSILAEFAENNGIFEYTANWIRRMLFDASPAGSADPAEYWTGERLEWTADNRHIDKKMERNGGYEFLQGRGKIRGRLTGGCMEVMEMIKCTELWPDIELFNDAILFLETSEDMPEPAYIGRWLRNYGVQGILGRLSALVWGKPYQGKYYEEYKEMILKVVVHEMGLYDLPIVYNMSFGHNEPMMCLPYGRMAEADCDRQTFAILESGVV